MKVEVIKHFVTDAEGTHLRGLTGTHLRGLSVHVTSDRSRELRGMLSRQLCANPNDLELVEVGRTYE